MNFFNSPDPRISLGGLAIGLGILIWQIAPWWWKGRKKGKGKKGGAAVESGGKRDPKALIPLAAGFAFGSAILACAGGVLGWIAYTINSTNSGIGDRALAGTTGQSEAEMAQNALPILTGGAAVIVLLALTAIITLWHALPKRLRIELSAGVWAGASLGLSAGASGIIARTLVPAVNSAGDALAGVL